MTRAAVLVPARDEEEALPGLIEALPPRRVERVLVVDNGSRDGTARAARAAGAEVVTEPSPGYGRACRRGLEALAALDRPPGLVAIVDADDPAAARRLGRVLEPLAADRADLVRGRRVPAGAEEGVPRHAALGNAAVAAVLRGLWTAPVRDVGPFRAARLDALRSLALDDPAYGWNVQMDVRALRAGWRLEEVDVPHRRRRTGRSKISGTVRGSIRAAAGMLGALAREALAPPGGPSPLRGGG